LIRHSSSFNTERIVWNKTKLYSQPERLLYTAEASKEYGFIAKTDINIRLKNN
jgi:hypothetical protein